MCRGGCAYLGVRPLGPLKLTLHHCCKLRAARVERGQHWQSGLPASWARKEAGWLRLGGLGATHWGPKDCVPSSTSREPPPMDFSLPECFQGWKLVAQDNFTADKFCQRRGPAPLPGSRPHFACLGIRLQNSLNLSCPVRSTESHCSSGSSGFPGTSNPQNTP